MKFERWARFGLLAALIPAAFGQFAPAPGSPYAAGGAAIAVAVADVNNDQIPDVVVLTNAAKNVMVLLGSASGVYTPAPGSPFSAGGAATALVVADFDGDQKPDLAVALQNSARSGILLKGDLTGVFTAGPTFDGGANPTFLATEDLNHDGLPDLVAAGLTDSRLTILLNDGKGGFQTAQGIAPSVSRATSVAIADFDADRNLDLAVTSADTNSVTLFYGNGQGGFATRPNSTFGTGPPGAQTAARPASVVTGDFNGDLIPDIAVANDGLGNVTVLLGTASGGLVPAAGGPIAVAAAGNALALCAADFNGDGNTDLAVLDGTGNRVSVLLSNGAGQFAAAGQSPYAVPPGAAAFAAGDVNGDSRLDLVAVDSGGGVDLLLNNIPAAATVSAATGLSPVAPGSIVAIYGSNLASAPATAATTPLPLNLGGTTVILTYGNGVQTALPLFYVSANQINAQIPPLAPRGRATLAILSPGGRQSGALLIASAAPGIFSANQNGKGAAAAQLVTLQANGFQSVTATTVCPGGFGTCIPVPLDVSSGNARLVLYGTGLNSAAVTATVGGEAVDVEYAGASGFIGEDQINLRLPANLAGAGLVRVLITAAGVLSNPVTIFIQ